MKNFQNIFKNKTIIVTGHTGFKGSWLTFWLKKLGAKVIGVSSKSIDSAALRSTAIASSLVVGIECRTITALSFPVE